MSERIVHPLAPIYNSESRILILGSFPSVQSRQKAFYYANPTNRFWKVLSAVFDEKIEDREKFCLTHRIALWDVIGSCRIKNSSDASITDVTVNPIAQLIKDTKVHTVITTGKKAGDLYQKYLNLPINHIELPSTSAANAKMRLDELIKYYQVVKEYAEKD